MIFLRAVGSVLFVNKSIAVAAHVAKWISNGASILPQGEVTARARGLTCYVHMRRAATLIHGMGLSDFTAAHDGAKRGAEWLGQRAKFCAATRPSGQDATARAVAIGKRTALRQCVTWFMPAPVR